MNLLDVILIGVGLSMDAFAITISNCITFKNTLKKVEEWSMPIMFALFQGLMPLIGFLIGSFFFDYIKDYAKYLTSAIFFILTLKIILDIIKENQCKEENKSCAPKFSFTLIIIQAFATSIDALIVGLTLNSASISIVISILVIALVTFIIVAIALILGKNLGLILGKHANYISATLMLFLAVKNLF